MRKSAMLAARLALAGLFVASSFAGGAAQAEARAEEAPTPDLLGGYPDGLFLRTRDSGIVLLPGARLQIDGAFFPRQDPKSGLFVRRARLELRGWLGGDFYFDVSNDFAPPPPAGTDVAPSALPAADDYLAFAPLGDRAILQVGQFDAPFTLENRTSDAYTDFIERAMTARTLGVPRNKEVGAMLHGVVADGRLTYAVGLFNGDGPGFRSVDNQATVIGRVAVTPLATGDGALSRLTIGGSAWYGDHVLGPEAAVQATPGGVVFFQPHWTVGPAPSQLVELHEQGSTAAFAGELSLPIAHRFGLRGEVVWKKQHLTEAEVSATGGLSPMGDAVLDGLAGYGELWLWLLGDDRLLPVPGQELPLRLAAGAPSFAHGLQLALRGEVLKEDLDSDNHLLGDPGLATTRVVSGTAGLTYWRGRFVRLSINYVLNYWSGTSETIQALIEQGRLEHEVLLRAALSL